MCNTPHNRRAQCHGRRLAAVLLLLLFGCAAGQRPSDTPISAGMRIDRSMTLRPGQYRIAADESLQQPLIRITGRDIVVDFAGAVLDGAEPDAPPDTFRGLAVLVEDGSNITLRNLTARGYKVAVLARNVQNLRITGCDLSYNYRQRLRSTLEREDVSDWLSYHHNDDDQWLRYGAGIYLSNCDGAQVDHCTISGGQNGLMMTRCNDALVWNNNFSFNSGVGLGLYRSSRNRIVQNRIDFCVRGYSHGVYNRGQDSAGILIYEQSSDNVIAYNSATHGGDGLFLWAGQSTMDTGAGGCNDNLIFENDFSHSPCNGIEVTFSRNTIVANRIEECWHGIWGGYSYDTLILANRFANNDEAIAIEHGQDNTIEANTFDRDRVGIRLWQRAKQDPDWGYPKHRDTSSRGYRIIGNTFEDVPKPFAITDTADVEILDDPQKPRAHDFAAPMLADGMDAMLPADHPRGRRFILVDEWGPYDFRSPRLWPREKLDDGRKRFEILGPPGRWTLLRKQGIEQVSAESGTVPGEIVVQPSPTTVVDMQLELEYVGSEVISSFGRKTAGGQPYRFVYSKFLAPIEWTVKWFAYDDSTDPRSQYDAFKKLLETEPIKQETTTELAYQWYGAIGPGLPADRFATLAEGVVDVPEGDYRIEVTSDDGVRVWVDDELVIDNWTWHPPTLDVAPVRLGGRHRVRVEHFEIDGYATLRLQLVPDR